MNLGVSMVVPARNAAETISQTLESLVNQTYQGFEVIVADNGSTDNTVALAKSFHDRLPNLLVIDASQIPGAGYARRAGSEAASGDYLLFVDSDDFVGSDDYVEKMVAALHDHPFVHAAMDMTKLNPPWYARERPGLGTQTAAVGDWKYAYGSTIGVRRAEYNLSGGWGVDLTSEDVDFSWRMKSVGCDLVCVPDAVVSVRARFDTRGSWRQGLGYGRFQSRSNRIWQHSGPPIESEWTLIPGFGRLIWQWKHVFFEQPRVFWIFEFGRILMRAKTRISDVIRRVPVRAPMGVPRPDTDPALERFRELRKTRA